MPLSFSGYFIIIYHLYLDSKIKLLRFNSKELQRKNTSLRSHRYPSCIRNVICPDLPGISWWDLLLFGSRQTGQIVGLSLVLLGETWGDEGNSFVSKMVQDGPKPKEPQIDQSCVDWLSILSNSVTWPSWPVLHACIRYQILAMWRCSISGYGLLTSPWEKKTEACECRWCTRSSLILPPKALTSAGPVFAKEDTNQGIVREGLFSQSGYDKASQMPSKWAQKRSESLVTQIHSGAIQASWIGGSIHKDCVGMILGYNNACALSTTQDTPWKFLRTCSRSNGQWCNCQHVY